MSERATVLPHRRSDLRAGDTDAWVGDLVVAFAALTGYAIVVFRETLIPARFSLDGEHLKSLALGVRAADADRSYGSVAAIYRDVGLADNDMLTGLLQFTVCCALTIWVYSRCRGRGVRSLPLAMTAGLTLFFGSVYLGFYSKDFFVLVITGVALVVASTVWIDIALVALMAAYAVNFRSYWWAVTFIYLTARLWGIGRRSLRSVLTATVIAALLVGLLLSTAEGLDPDHFRTSVNSIRAGDAQSIIQAFVTFPQPAGGLINIALTVGTLMIPIPLLASGGGVYYLVLALTISVLWLMFLKAFTIGSRRRSVAVGRSDLRLSSTRVGRAAALVFAFLAVQAVFEPDYGSALRHLTPLMPLFVVVTGLAPGSTKSGFSITPADGSAISSSPRGAV